MAKKGEINAELVRRICDRMERDFYSQEIEKIYRIGE